jgi:DNA-binding GntR family transcriptional regulator
MGIALDGQGKRVRSGVNRASRSGSAANDPGADATPRSLRDALETAILTGDYAPGEKLEEVALAQRFGVSRTPVREALHHLAAAGLVVSRPRRGAVVATLSPVRLVEMFELMAEFEALAARLAARRLAPEGEGELVEAMVACNRATASGPDAYYYENERFHFALYRASGNTFLEEQARALHRRLKPYRRLQLQVRNRVAASLAEHAAIVEALRAGKAEEAASVAREHVAVQGERFADLMAGLRAMEP